MQNRGTSELQPAPELAALANTNFLLLQGKTVHQGKDRWRVHRNYALFLQLFWFLNYLKIKLLKILQNVFFTYNLNFASFYTLFFLTQRSHYYFTIIGGKSICCLKPTQTWQLPPAKAAGHPPSPRAHSLRWGRKTAFATLYKLLSPLKIML